MGHKRDWKQYNKQLVNRGKINLWIKREALEQWKPAHVKKNGHPFRYSDELIKTLSFLRFKFKLSLRETEGFFSIVHRSYPIRCLYPMLHSDLPQTLQLPAELLGKKNITDIALDTTGLKVYGEGEWRAEKYGGERRDGKKK